MTKFKTPKIPAWIKTLSCAGYTNVFQLGLGNQNIFGTETLLGDWDGPLLLVAKDFAPVTELQNLIDGGVSKELIYRHNDGDGRYRAGTRTNPKLLDLLYGAAAPSMISGNRNTHCGTLYISACFFLKSGSDVSSGLSGWTPGACAFDNSARVVRFVIDNMPNLAAVACMGNEAAKLVEVAAAHRPGIFIGRVPHPAARISNERHSTSWADFMRNSSIAVKDGIVIRNQTSPR